MKLKKGDVVTISSGLLQGVDGYIVRISKRTGGLTVKLTTEKAHNAYKIGSEVNVAQFEVTRKMEARA